MIHHYSQSNVSFALQLAATAVIAKSVQKLCDYTLNQFCKNWPELIFHLIYISYDNICPAKNLVELRPDYESDIETTSLDVGCMRLINPDPEICGDSDCPKKLKSV